MCNHSLHNYLAAHSVHSHKNDIGCGTYHGQSKLYPTLLAEYLNTMHMVEASVD